MRPDLRQALVAGGVLAAFALGGTALLSFAEFGTRERIEANERAALVEALAVLIDPARHDNDVLDDTIEIAAPELGTDEPVTVYRARRGGEPVALVLTAVAPDGYSGPIRLLVAIDFD